MAGLLHAIILTVHILASAAWFGGMFYSFFVLHPRARAFFSSPRQVEEFVVFVAGGARWKVLFGAAVIAVTGLMLMPGHDHAPALWWTCLSAKVMLFLCALAVFAYTSWKAWPARLFAAPEEIPRFQRQFRWIALALMGLVALCFFLGVLPRCGSMQR